MRHSVDKRFLAEISKAKLRLIRDAILARYGEAPAFYHKCLANIADRRLLTRMWSATVEDVLLDVCKDDPGLYAVATANRRRSWGFALVESQHFLFTAATLRSLRAKPPRAGYREDLGTQTQLFSPRPIFHDPVDSLLIHVAPRRIETRPSQLMVRFFNGEGQYHSELIDLLSLDTARVFVMPRVRLENVERKARAQIKRVRRDETPHVDA